MRGAHRYWFDRAVKAEAECERLRAALRDDPGKWSFATLVTVARLLLDENYPADIFTGVSGDPGPVFVVRLREALAALGGGRQ